MIFKVVRGEIQTAIFLLNLGIYINQRNVDSPTASEIVIGCLRVDREVDGRVARTAAKRGWCLGIPVEKILFFPSRNVLLLGLLARSARKETLDIAA